ncbi:MAG: hypothetical protein IGS39_19250 [Calothrix sp. C42_A2020_038]|nr:hypothetical protein [Calothrix sp. C42_A2020_038]
MVELTLAWLGRYRRLSKDFDPPLESAPIPGQGQQASFAFPSGQAMVSFTFAAILLVLTLHTRFALTLCPRS